MSSVKRKSIIILFLSILIASSAIITSAQEQEKKQEITEEFFYAEEEVEIASLKPQKVEEAPGIVSVITAQQIKDMGARDLNDVLKIVPGFQLPVWYMYSATYGVRGLKESANSRILVMLDGVPLNEVYDGQSNLNWADMPINNVKRIEIIRGPGSALYGTYAFLATINIITYKAEDIDGIEFSAGGGSWNTQHHYLLFGKKKNDFSFSGYVDYRKSDGYDNYWIEQDLVTILYSYVPFLPSISKAPGKIQVPLDSKRVDFRMSYKEFEFQFKAQDYERGAPLTAMAVTEAGASEKDRCYIGQALYNRKVNDKLSLLLKGYFYNRKMHLAGQSYPRGMFGPLMIGLNAQGFFPDGFKYELNEDFRNIGLNTRFDYALNGKNIFTFGIEYNDLSMAKPVAYSNIDPVYRTQSSQLHEVSGTTAGVMDRAADRKVLALFIQDNWQIGEKLNITAGLRVDHYSDFGASVNPRLSLIWKLRENTNMKLLYGHAFRAPTFSDFYTIAPNKVGNENLGPEKVRSFEVGVNHKFTPDIIAGINYFYNALTDIISPTGEVIIEGYPLQLMNSGKVNAQGMEAEIKANFQKNSYAYFNYSYAKAKDEHSGEVVPNVANNLFNFGLNVGAWKYLNANLCVNYVGERKRGEQILPLFGILDPRDPIKAYSLFDLTLRGQNFWKNTEVIFSIHNLLNTEYTDPEEQGIIYYDFPREGRQILGKVIFKF